MTEERIAKIAWREWDDDAFREAEERDVPILLDISAVWCHWCHVMDRTTYDDDAVARTIEDGFVPVRVDNDRRPDINRRYNMGGWPTTAFLTPAGELLTGGTYFPPDAMGNLLGQVSEAWSTRKDEFEAKITQAAARRGLAGPSPRGPLTPAIVDRILGGVIARYDRRHGGFGSAPKFPHPAALELLVNRHATSPDRTLRSMLFTTLDGMTGGGMYDHVEGGFYRYSTTEDWSVPHFEKMAEDNARLLLICLAAGTLDDGDRFLKMAADVFGWVEATMTDPAGGFFGSQDADEEYSALDEAGRSRREAPFVDRTLYADWNGLMARAHLLGARLLGDPSLRDRGLAALERVDALMGPAESGLAHHVEGSEPGSERGFLGDHAQVGLAFLDAHAETGDRMWLDRARDVVGFALDRLAADEGGFLDRPPGAGHGTLGVPTRPLEENSAMATFLLRLGRMVRDDALIERAWDTLAIYADGFDLYDLMGAPYAVAVDEALAEPVHVTVVGPADGGRPLRAAALAGFIPHRLVDHLVPGRDDDLLERAGYPPSDRAVAYVCVGTTCHAPTEDPAEVKSSSRAGGPGLPSPPGS